MCVNVCLKKFCLNNYTAVVPPPDVPPDVGQGYGNGYAQKGGRAGKPIIEATLASIACSIAVV